MENWNLNLGVVVSALAIAGTGVSLATWFVKVQIAGLSQQMAALQKELHEYKEQVTRMDERQRRHTGDTEIHISATWRAEWGERLTRMEGDIRALLLRGNSQ